MSVREHERAAALALVSNEELRRLVNRLGTREAPNGRVLTAYRQARRAMAQAVASGQPGAVAEVLAELRRVLAEVGRVVLAAAAQAGTTQARAELAVYGLPNAGLPVYGAEDELGAWLAQVDAQGAAVRGLWQSTGDGTVILGDEERAGVLSPGPVVREGARWVGVALLAGWALAVADAMRRSGRDDFLRQAVAAIDERTTDCCLRVHGQVVGMREDFHLTGTPRYGEWMRNPPFHWYCRTSVCLVRAEDGEDRLSVEMREAAARELEARDLTGGRVEIHPADARSGR
jgi:hypothetical protein